MIKQRKGEAEMSQADWLKDVQLQLHDGECVINYVTSADIDTIVIQIFAVSLYWPRNPDSTFKFPVYVWLQKQKPEIYNITGKLTILERAFPNKYIGAILAIVLSMGGNDYLPNFHGISHEKLLNNVFSEPGIVSSLLQFKEINESGVKRFKCTIDVDQYVKLYLKLYYPKNVEQEKLTFEEVRQLTIKIPGKSDFRHPQTWMPPESSLRQLAKLVQCQIDYLLTVFNPGASLPNFMASGCLKVRQDGSTIYNLGPNCHIDNRDNLITVSEETLANKLKAHTIPLNRKSGKRQLDDTPQKGKSSKRQPKMSTPRKIQARRKLPD